MDVTGLGAVAELATGVINRIWPDASEAEKSRMSLALAQLNAELDVAKIQAGVNQKEAESESLFVSGWRPGVGWICVLALGYQYLLYPLLTWLVLWFPSMQIPKPVISDVLFELIFGMLGLAGLRSFEKFKGIARK